VLLWLTTLLNQLDVAINLWALGGTGLIAGFLGSALGVGGGFLIVPILTLALRLPIQVAIGSSLVAIVANSCTASSVYTKARLTNVKLGLLLETATIPGAIIGGLAVALISPSILSVLFGLILLYVAYTMVVRRHLVSEGVPSADNSPAPDSLSASLAAQYYDKNLGKVVTYKVHRVPAGLGAGFFAGVLSSLLGIGGGIIKVPVIHLVMGLPMKATVATSAFMIAITATAGALLYQYHGYIYPFIVAPLVIGMVIGARVGVELTQRAGGMVLRRVFGALLFLIALLMFLKTANVI
jgi:uncharacterized membrane protein YfcA